MCDGILSGVFSKSLTVLREESRGQKCLPREEHLEVSLEKSQMEAGKERGVFQEQETAGAASGRVPQAPVYGWGDRGERRDQLG